MLKIINNLKPFIEDCYRRINVREYSRIMKISPPTSSKILAYYHSKELLLVEKERNYLFYYANRKSKLFIDISRIYWSIRLQGLVSFLNKGLTNPVIILFGSLSKAEAKKDSDVDICIIGYKQDLNIARFESQIKRKIQLLFFNSFKDIKNEELANNILNGYIVDGRMKL